MISKRRNLNDTLESIRDLTKIQIVSIYEIDRLLNILDRRSELKSCFGPLRSQIGYSNRSKGLNLYIIRQLIEYDLSIQEDLSYFPTERKKMQPIRTQSNNRSITQ